MAEETQEVSAAQFQTEMRAHMAELQAAVAQGRPTPRPELANAPSAEDALTARLAEVADYPFYCPGCGSLYKYQRQCVGLHGAAPHAPLEVVSTDELTSGDPSTHTPAPATTT